MSVSEIKQMSKSERLGTMELLWEALIDDESELESPDWHAAVLAERAEKMKSPDAKFFTLDQLRERFRK